MTPREILTACRAARGTPYAAPLRRLLHALARERRFRKHVEALRMDQSARLYLAARDRDRVLGEGARFVVSPQDAALFTLERGR